MGDLLQINTEQYVRMYVHVHMQMITPHTVSLTVRGGSHDIRDIQECCYLQSAHIKTLCEVVGLREFPVTIVLAHTVTLD